MYQSNMSRQLLPRKSLFTDGFESEQLTSFDCSSPSDASSLSTISMVSTSFGTRPAGSVNSRQGLSESVSQKHCPWSPTVSSFNNRPSFNPRFTDLSEKKQYAHQDGGLSVTSESADYSGSCQKSQLKSVVPQRRAYSKTKDKYDRERTCELNSFSAVYSHCSDMTNFSPVYAKCHSNHGPDQFSSSQLKDTSDRTSHKNHDDHCPKHGLRRLQRLSQTSVQSGDDYHGGDNNREEPNYRAGSTPVYYVCHANVGSQKLSDSQLIRIPVIEDKNRASNITSCLESHIRLGSERLGSVEQLVQKNVTESAVCCTHGVSLFVFLPEMMPDDRLVRNVFENTYFRENNQCCNCCRWSVLP